MEFKSQICTTREQSERLIALGLKKETADMVLVPSSRHDGSDVIRVRKSYLMEEDAIPAWSLHRLIEIMPSYIDVDNGAYLAMNNHSVTYLYYYEEEMNTYIEFNVGKNIYDDLINCIKWLIKEEHFNKTYLE